MTLAEALAAEFPEPESPEERERFVIDDDAKADWALRVLARIDADQADVEEEARRHHALIDQWSIEKLSRLGDRRGFFAGMLAGYHRLRLHENPRDKSISLPHGVLRSRKQQLVWDVQPDAFLEWATENGHRELVRVRIEPDKAAIKRQLSPMTDETGQGGAVAPDTGELVPGVTVTQPDEPTYTYETRS